MPLTSDQSEMNKLVIN